MTYKYYEQGTTLRNNVQVRKCLVAARFYILPTKMIANDIKILREKY